MLDSNAKFSFIKNNNILLAYKNCKILLDIDSDAFFIFQEIFMNDEYEIFKNNEFYDNVIDIGANIGLFSIAILNRCDNLFSIEPVRNNYAKLIDHIKLNNGDISKAFRYAAADKSGKKISIHTSSKHSALHY